MELSADFRPWDRLHPARMVLSHSPLDLDTPRFFYTGGGFLDAQQQ
jgi:hypothetical protein